MDVLFLTVCLTVCTLLVIYNKKTSRPNTKLPPGNTGWPIVGETLEFAMTSRRGCPEKFFKDRMSKYSSEVFKTSLFGDKMAILCGPAAHKFLFSSENKSVTAWFPRPLLKVLQASTAVEDTIKDATAMRSLMLDFMKAENLRKYVPVMDSTAKEYIEADWSPPKQVNKVFPLAKKYTFALSCRLLIQVEDPNRASDIHESLELLTDALDKLPVNIPGSGFSRGVKSGKVLLEQLVQVIKQRKRDHLLDDKSSPKLPDLVSRAITELKGDDQTVSENDIASKISGLVIASYDTTSSAITVVINFLAQHPHVFQKVFKEQMEIANSKAPGELLNWEDVQKMKYSWCVACESMRIYAPAQVGFREAVTDFTYAGYTIPKGWKVCYSMNSTHKNPEYFKDPEKFDPSRFEGNGPMPYTFVPFGGGPRMCQGKEYARLAMLTFIHNVVTKFKLEKVDRNEKVAYKPFVTFENGLSIRLKPHND